MIQDDRKSLVKKIGSQCIYVNANLMLDW